MPLKYKKFRFNNKLFKKYHFFCQNLVFPCGHEEVEAIILSAAFVRKRKRTGFTIDLELVDQHTLAVKDFEVDFPDDILEVQQHLSMVGIRRDLKIYGL